MFRSESRPAFALERPEMLASTPASARCAQVIFGPFGPYTLMNSALVGRPARAYSRVPSTMLARAELLRVTGVVVGAGFVVAFLSSLVSSRPYSASNSSSPS